MNTERLIERARTSRAQQLLTELYRVHHIDKQRQRYANLLKEYEKIFGKGDTTDCAVAIQQPN